MNEDAEQENSGLDVKFYPIRNRYLERSVGGVSRLLKVILFLCAFITIIVAADFLGYAFEDFKNFFTGSGETTLMDDAKQELDRTAGKLTIPSMFAGHSYSADSIGQMHSRISLQKMLTDQASNSQSAEYGYFGIDVSHWQHNIQWNEIAADSIPKKIDFSIIKATQGASWVDPDFTNNWKQSNRLLTISGAYHYYIFTDDPQAQANNFIENVTLSQGNLPPIVDIELNCSSCDSLHISQEKLKDDLITFFEAIENHFTVKPMIYTNVDFYNEYLAGEFNEYVFWMAEYEKNPPNGLIGFSSQQENTRNVPTIAIWQFTDYDHLAGIVGKTDMNFMPEEAKNTIQFVTE